MTESKNGNLNHALVAKRDVFYTLPPSTRKCLPTSTTTHTYSWGMAALPPCGDLLQQNLQTAATKLYPAQSTNPHKYSRKTTTYCNKNRRKAQIHTNTAENPPPTATKTGEKHKSAQIPPKIHHLLQQKFTQLKAQIHTNTAENPPPTATKNRAASTDTARWWRP